MTITRLVLLLMAIAIVVIVIRTMGGTSRR